VPPKRKRSADSATGQVRVLDRAIDILDCFSSRTTELSVAEIVERTGLNRSTVRRLLATLARRGLIQETLSVGQYSLGLRLFEMGGIVFSTFSLRDAASEPLAALQDQVSGTILLAARSGDHFVIVDRREGVFDGLAMVSMRSEIGTVRPLTHGPIGQVFMSTLSEPARQALLERYPLEQHTPFSMTDADRLLARLSEVLNAGYARDVNEIVEGIMGLAVPILDFSSETVGVLCLGVPTTRENDVPFVEAALASLRQASAAISTNMGYSGDGHSMTIEITH